MRNIGGIVRWTLRPGEALGYSLTAIVGITPRPQLVLGIDDLISQRRTQERRHRHAAVGDGDIDGPPGGRQQAQRTSPPIAWSVITRSRDSPRSRCRDVF